MDTHRTRAHASAAAACTSGEAGALLGILVEHQADQRAAKRPPDHVFEHQLSFRACPGIAPASASDDEGTPVDHSPRASAASRASGARAQSSTRPIRHAAPLQFKLIVKPALAAVELAAP